MKEGEKDRLIRHKRESGARAIELDKKIDENKEERKFQRREQFNPNNPRRRRS